MAELRRTVRIFLAEDNPADAFLLKEALESHGIEHEIDRCVDGEDCVGRLTTAMDRLEGGLRSGL